MTFVLSRVLANSDDRNLTNLALMLTKTHEFTQTRVRLKQKKMECSSKYLDTPTIFWLTSSALVAPSFGT
jgi:hypothetical protein